MGCNNSSQVSSEEINNYRKQRSELEKQIKTFFYELEDKKQMDVKLVDKIPDTDDSFIFRFDLKNQIVGGDVPGQVRLGAIINHEMVQRSYTIISASDDEGYLDIAIKIYNPTEQYPQGGVFTQHLNQIKIGQTIKFMYRPLKKIKYLEQGMFEMKDYETGQDIHVNVTKLNIVVGGSGVTPSITILKRLVKEGFTNIQVKLVYANRTKKSVMLYDMVNELVRKVGGVVTYVYSQESEENLQGDKELVGYCNEQILRERLGGVGNDTLNLYCGPPPMNNAVRDILLQIGHNEKMIIQF